MTRAPRRPAPKTPASVRPASVRPPSVRKDPARPDQRSPASATPDAPVRNDGTVWLYGRHPVEAALANPARKCLRLLATQGGLKDLPLGSRSPQPEIVLREDLETVLPAGALHQGLALQVRPLHTPSLEDIARIEGPGVVAILDQVSDPHNVGAILRSAAAFGLKALVVQDRHSPEETGVLAKSASGALERLPLVRVANLSRAIETLQGHGYWCAGLDARATTPLSQARLSDRCVVVLGSEGSGLRRLVGDHCDLLVSLPMAGQMESLNVSNAAAIAFYELTRSRS